MAFGVNRNKKPEACWVKLHDSVCNTANMAIQMKLNGAVENPMGLEPKGKNSIDSVEVASDSTHLRGNQVKTNGRVEKDNF